MRPRSRRTFGPRRLRRPAHARLVAPHGAAACGIPSDVFHVLDEDWEEAFFIEKCADCFAAVLASGHRSSHELASAGHWGWQSAAPG